MDIQNVYSVAQQIHRLKAQAPETTVRFLETTLKDKSDLPKTDCKKMEL